jgi:PAS domain S-box-containing protein
MTGAAAPTAARDRALTRPSAWLVGAFAVVTVALLLAGFVFYRSQERYQRAEARDSLTAVSVLKVDQISRWRDGRLADAALWSEDPYLAGPVLGYLSAPTPAAQAALRSGLLAWKQYKAWADIAVTDPGGNVLFSLSGETGPLPRDKAAALQQAFSLHRPVLTDLHREPGVSPRLSAVAPLFATAKGIATPAGAVILRCDAASALYPLILTWPTASRTAETLLVRRDGDAMLFLNELRYRSHTALELRVPLTQRDLPSVMAANGVTGFVEGVDYRGVPVFADIRAIPGTPWFAITKIDVAEAMAPLRVGAIQLAGLLGGLLAAVGTLFFALGEFRARRHSQLLMEAETARSASDARLAAIIDGSQDPISAFTLDGVFTAWNRAAEGLFGYSAAEVIGQPIGRLVPPGSRGGEGGILGIIRGGGWIEPYETRCLTKDGRLVDLWASISSIKDASGRIVGASCIAHDITRENLLRHDLERLRWMLSPPGAAGSQPTAQGAACLHAKRNRARLIVDAAGDSLLSDLAAIFNTLMGTSFAVYEASGDLAYSVLSSGWCRFLNAGSMQHCASTVVCEPQARGKCICHGSPGNEACFETTTRGQPVDIECAGGLRLYSVPIRAGGEVVGSMSLGYGDPPRDPARLAQLAAQFGVDAVLLERHAADYETRPPFIVELAKQRLAGSAHLLGEIVRRSRGEALLRETRDELARSNRELERFAHIASHDLQEPLRMVASYTQLLAQRYHDQLDQDGRDFIDYAVDGATRMKQLIEDLLSYSRVTARGLPVAVVDTCDALALALRNLEAAIGETHAEVTGGDLPEVLADGSQIVQLFQNLVANAIKFRTPGVTPRVCIEARQAPDHPRQWLFRVADNGIGIAPRFFDRVFVIFQRLHTRHEYPGTGIGLALCQRIVERYGGRIWIESEPGQGTAFLFTLPEVDTDKGEP